jgi:tRNA G46 methylase TrmB
VTLELRHDRVYQTATKMIFAEARNMCVMGGDAMLVLPRNFPDKSVGNVFVNHPEPPQQTGGETSEGQHLLNEVSIAITQPFYY